MNKFILFEFMTKTPAAELHLIKLVLDTCIKHNTTLEEMKDLSEVLGKELGRRHEAVDVEG